MFMSSKIIILSAPSGSGKTTIAQSIVADKELNCMFSVSATSREPRSLEKDKEHYYFLKPDIFKNYIEQNKFIEWEEVYNQQFYGTLKSEIERIKLLKCNILFDVDVKGGIKLKNIFGTEALSIFIMPPSVQVLEQRLRCRKTETQASIEKRLKKAEIELTFAPQFDKIIVNHVLNNAITEIKSIIKDFFKQ